MFNRIRSGLLQPGEARFDRFGVGMAPDLVPRTHAFAPVRHRARAVLLFNFLKSLPGFFVPEGMKQGDALLKILLRIRRARDGEMNRSQLFLREVFVMMAFVGYRYAAVCRSDA